ncbi:MAG: hypothetical protein AVDCRST_MAG68-4293, partial [uncultured Gemmatimonadetes bacterium]
EVYGSTRSRGGAACGRVRRHGGGSEAGGGLGPPGHPGSRAQPAARHQRRVRVSRLHHGPHRPGDDHAVADLAGQHRGRPVRRQRAVPDQDRQHRRRGGGPGSPVPVRQHAERRAGSGDVRPHGAGHARDAQPGGQGHPGHPRRHGRHAHRRYGHGAGAALHRPARRPVLHRPRAVLPDHPGPPPRARPRVHDHQVGERLPPGGHGQPGAVRRDPRQRARLPAHVQLDGHRRRAAGVRAARRRRHGQQHRDLGHYQPL